MFSLRLPIPIENTLTPPSKHTPISSSIRFQTHRFPLVYLPKHRGLPTCTATANVAVPDDVQGKPNDGTNVAETSPVPEPLPSELQPDLIPKHVAVIMDGNARWAKQRGFPASAGHEAGVRSLRRLIELCRSWGIKVLTVFAFSTDNWLRPKVNFVLKFCCLILAKFDFQNFICYLFYLD